MKVYFAHGHVVHSENMTTGEETWKENSAFSEVFFDFERAKQYLLDKFETLFKRIYREDSLSECDSREDRDIRKASPEWQREYLAEYIDYNLVISEIFPENAEKSDFSHPYKIDWVLRSNGEVKTRYLCFGDREIEFREEDGLPEAGSKFKVGDLVEYTDPEFYRDYEGVLIVCKVPDKPQDKNIPWVNLYKVCYIENATRKGIVETASLHESDLRAVNKENHTIFNEPSCVLQKEAILALQRAISGEAKLSEKQREDILRGKVLFHTLPFWRDIPELKIDNKE